MAYDSEYEDEPARPPVSLHPAFPAIVALWFAALLGLGSLVLPAVLLERMVGATGLAALVPAAAPPLGITARGIIALVGALAGCGLGVLIARRVAQAHRPEPVSRIAKLAGGSRRPISVHDELGGEGVVNGESLPLNRRRALAISEDDRPSDFLYQIPLPGADPDAPAPFAAAPFVGVGADDEEPLELSELAGDEAEPVSAQPADADEPDETDGDFEMTDSKHTSAWPSHQHYPAGSEPAVAEELDSRKNRAGPRGLEPLPFSAPSLARRASEPASEPEVEAEPEAQLEAVATPVAVAAEEPAFRADWETAPLEGLGLVQLVQRLGSTIERRRELAARSAATVAAAPAPFASAPADLEPAAAEEAAQAMAAFFAPAPAPAAVEPVAAGATDAPASFDAEPEQAAMPLPGFLEPIEEADDEGDDAVPDFSLPLRRPAPATPSFAPADNDAGRDEVEAEPQDDDGENGFSSLLDLNNPFVAKAEFVRIDVPEDDAAPVEPAVVFPGQEESARPAEPVAAFGARIFDPPGKAPASPAPAPQAAADADAALRAALATLQRMSGAA